MKLLALAALLAAVPGLSAPARADAPRILDIRVGQHQDHERIVIELERGVDARWYTRADETLVLDFGARPLLPEQTLATGRPGLGSIHLLSTSDGARLSLAAGERRARAFALDDPPRLVLDVAGTEAGPLALPPGVRGIPRCHGRCEPGPEASTPQGLPTADRAPDAAEQAAALPALPEPAPGDLLDAEEADVAALDAPAAAPRLSRAPALLVPLLLGAGLLLIAIGGIALAGIGRPRRARAEEEVEVLAPAAAAEVDRMTLLERRLEEELAARRLLEGQLAHAAREIAGLRAREPQAAASDAD